jgi:steroid delta-isomerase-like uncharacterized protein
MSDGAESMQTLVDAFNKRDFESARGLLADDLTFEDVAAGVTVSGPDGFFGYAGAWAGAFSDMEITVLSIVGDDTHAAGELSGGGTHDGTLPTPQGPVPPTGKRFDERFTWYADIADGKITGLRDYYNMMSIMTQLGLMDAGH